MVDYLKLFEKCRDKKCGNLFSEKELQQSKNEYTKTYNKKCGKEKDMTKQIKCTMKVLGKSSYQKLLKKRTKCAEIKCKKERQNFRKEFSKSIKKFKKRRKQRNTKKKKRKH